ncbi:MAG: murein L,D-transpeptidase family protein [Pseudomonadota bacterium]
MTRIALILLCLCAIGAAALAWRAPHLLPRPVAERLGLAGDLAEIRARVTAPLTESLASKGLTFGAPVYLRVFKEEAELELWVEGAEAWTLFKTYPICAFSGDLGPKQAEGDGQAPEGFYTVTTDQLNPRSRFHLSFDLGFPNAYDRAQGWTGSHLMIHGDCVSIGCYAMTDAGIEEIYLLVDAALTAGQRGVEVHAYPFHMTEARLATEEGNAWYPFWRQMRFGYMIFDRLGDVPFVTVEDGNYTFSD